MNIFFAILSVAYITGIFLFADSSLVSTVNRYNPYSLLHIPLYGILSILLTFSIQPVRIHHPNPFKKWTYPQIAAVNPSIPRLFMAGSIAFGVGMADEIYQSFLPNRDASVTDVLLDLIGIILALLFILQWYKKIVTRENTKRDI